MSDTTSPGQVAPAQEHADDDEVGVHAKLGLLTRQLHESLRELGYADTLQGTVEELPDAKNRLSYIARLTGEAAEKVLALVDDAKERQTNIVNETKAMRAAMIADPVAAVAKGQIMNYLEHMDKATEIVDNQLTEIMMAQNFHDLTGQVIARVVKLAGNLEQQLLRLLLETAPQGSAAAAAAAFTGQSDPSAPLLPPAKPTKEPEGLQGPVVDPDNTPNVVTSQSEVDDLLASLGF